MAGKDIIVIRQRELKRLHIIHKVLDKKLKQVSASEMLSLSDRQIRRIIKRVRLEGDKGVTHKTRGNPSNRRLPKKVKDKVIKIYRERYNDFGPTLAAEKLLEINKIKISDETLRRWLIQTGDWTKVRKGRTYREWRERKHHLGEMMQMDGSHHDWFEGRAPKCVLMGYIDDATSNTYGRFYSYEGTIPAMDSFKRYIEKYGIPVSVYLDKHSTYKSNSKPSIEDELNNTEPLSEFGRALKELGVNLIHAHSPQAKGRVERLFGTFQDRLVKEMRLKGIKNIEGGNKFLEEYLPVYNKRFAVSPKENNNFHRSIPKDIELDRILCIKAERVLRNDFTIAYDNKIYQIKDNVKARKVVIEERIDGSMVISYKDTILRFQEITARPKAKEESKPSVIKPKKVYRPKKDHPWKRVKVDVSIQS